MSSEPRNSSELHPSDPIGRERIYIERLRAMSRQLEATERELSELTERTDDKLAELAGQLNNLESEVAEQSREMGRQRRNMARLRLDRQLTGIPSWLWSRVRRRTREAPAPPESGPSLDRSLDSSPGRGAGPHRSLLLVVPTYPIGSRRYGGQPVQRRVRFYRESGFDVTILVTSGADETDPARDGVRVVRGKPESIPRLIDELGISQLCIHHPEADSWRTTRELRGHLPVHLWIHGFEARDWRDLHFNYSDEEIEEIGARLDAVTFDRRKVLREAFRDQSVTKIFVSEYMRNHAQGFAGAEAENAFVIHNVIDTDVFAYRVKESADRLKILSIRSFANRNYATDLITDAIQLLADQPFFDELSFTVIGDGKHFDDDTREITGLSNVDVSRKVLDAPEMVSAFDGHGIMLIPTRWDSQGMTMGEAMSSGLVPVTNAVAAIPEFVDESSGVLAGEGDAHGLAEGIARLYRDPELFLDLSQTAARRVRAQSSPEQTVKRELELFELAEQGVGE